MMPDAACLAGSGIQRREVIVHTLPSPDRLVLDWQQPPVCFLTDDGTPLSGGLAGALTRQGWQVVVLQWPPEVWQASVSLPESIARVTLTSITEELVQAGLEAATRIYGPASAMICLEPVWTSAGKPVPESGTLPAQYLQGVFWLAKYLQPDLTQNRGQGRNAFLSVAHLDGLLGTSGEGHWSPVSGGVFGLVKTLNLEWETVFCRAIDLHPDLSAEQSASHILAEMADPDRLLVEVGWGPQQRVTLVLADAAGRIQ